MVSDQIKTETSIVKWLESDPFTGNLNFSEWWRCHVSLHTRKLHAYDRRHCTLDFALDLGKASNTSTMRRIWKEDFDTWILMRRQANKSPRLRLNSMTRRLFGNTSNVWPTIRTGGVNDLRKHIEDGGLNVRSKSKYTQMENIAEDILKLRALAIRRRSIDHLCRFPSAKSDPAILFVKLFKTISCTDQKPPARALVSQPNRHPFS